METFYFDLRFTYQSSVSRLVVWFTCSLMICPKMTVVQASVLLSDLFQNPLYPMVPVYFGVR